MSAALATVDRPIVRVHMNRASSEPVVQRMHSRCGGKPAWFACQTHPQSERWAAANLRQAGYLTYLPLYTTRVRDRVLHTLIHEVERPLFTGYLFVQLAETQPWTPIWHTPGVARMLGSGQRKPDMVRAGAVEAVQAGDASRRSVQAPGASWAPGTPCRLATGSLKDHEGVVLAVNRLTATVGLLLFGQMREVTVRLDCLIPRGSDAQRVPTYAENAH